MCDEAGGWWVGARLLLKGKSASGIELAQGGFADLILLAVTANVVIQPHLSIKTEVAGVLFDWPKISELAHRIDFPIII